MSVGRHDYMKRRSYNRTDRHYEEPTHVNYYGSHTYGPDHARMRHDYAMSRSRNRRRRRDHSYGVGHYIYNTPSPTDYVPVLDHAAHDNEYKHDLNEWIHRMRQYDKFQLSKEDVIHKAKEMNIRFDEFSEDELYAAYLLHTKIYANMHSEPHMYIACAKSWLEEEEIASDPSEKLCKYLYEIVLGE